MGHAIGVSVNAGLVLLGVGATLMLAACLGTCFLLYLRYKHPKAPPRVFGDTGRATAASNINAAIAGLKPGELLVDNSVSLLGVRRRRKVQGPLDLVGS
jgi:hypothetical protein